MRELPVSLATLREYLSEAEVALLSPPPAPPPLGPVSKHEYIRSRVRTWVPGRGQTDDDAYDALRDEWCERW